MQRQDFSRSYDDARSFVAVTQTSRPIEGATMKKSHVILAAAAAVAFLAGGMAQAATRVDDLVPRDLPVTLPGSYLAGRGADADRDFGSRYPLLRQRIRKRPDQCHVGRASGDAGPGGRPDERGLRLAQTSSPRSIPRTRSP